MKPKRYSDKEAREILKRAVDIHEDEEMEYTRDELVTMGREMGLSQEAIAKAEEAYLANGEIETPVLSKSKKSSTFKLPLGAEEIAYRRHRMKGFYVHLGFYGVVVAFLFLMNWISTGLGEPWFIFPAFGLGLGLPFHLYYARQTKGFEYKTEFARWRDVRAMKIRNLRRRLDKDESLEV